MSLRKNASGQLIKKTDGSLINDCNCCALGIPCGCLPSGGTMCVYVHDAAGVMIQDRILGSDAFDITVNPYDITSITAAGTNDTYKTYPWMTDPQLVTLTLNVSGTHTSAARPPYPSGVTPGYPVNIVAKLTLSARYVSSKTSTTNQDDYYVVGGRYPISDYVVRSTGGQQLNFTGHNEVSSIGTWTTSDVNVGTITYYVTFNRITNTYNINWYLTVNGAGTHRIIDSSTSVVQTTNPNTWANTPISFDIQVQTLVDGLWEDAYIKTVTFTPERYTNGVTCLIENGTLLKTTTFAAFNASNTTVIQNGVTGFKPANMYYGGSWVKEFKIGSATVLNTPTSIVNSTLSNWGASWAGTRPSGGAVTIAVTLPASYASIGVKLHSLNDTLRTQNITISATGAPYVKSITVTGTSAKPNGTYENPLYTEIGIEKDITLTYAGGEDAGTQEVACVVAQPIGAVNIDLVVTWDTGNPVSALDAAPLVITGTYAAGLLSWPAQTALIDLLTFQAEMSIEAGSKVLDTSLGIHNFTIDVEMNMIWYYDSSLDEYGEPSYPQHTQTSGTFTNNNPAPNPIRVKINTSLVETAPNVSITDTVTHILVNGVWTIPAAPYQISYSGYPVTINQSLGSASTGSGTITLKYFDGITEIGSGSLSSNFAGVQAGVIPPTIPLNYCDIDTTGIPSTYCGRRFDRKIWSRSMTVDYLAYRVVGGVEDVTPLTSVSTITSPLWYYTEYQMSSTYTSATFGSITLTCTSNPIDNGWLQGVYSVTAELKHPYAGGAVICNLSETINEALHPNTKTFVNNYPDPSNPANTFNVYRRIYMDINEYSVIKLSNSLGNYYKNVGLSHAWGEIYVGAVEGYMTFSNGYEFLVSNQYYSINAGISYESRMGSDVPGAANLVELGYKDVSAWYAGFYAEYDNDYSIKNTQILWQIS